MINSNAAIHYSRGESRFDNSPDQRSCNSFDEFETAVLSDRSPQKGLAFICSPLQRGIHYQKPENYPGAEHWRLKDYALPRQFISFDFDGFSSPDVFPVLMDYLSRFRGFGYSTASHTDDAPRARAILLSSRPVSRAECIDVCQSIQDQISKQLGDSAVIFDESVYRGEQPVYTPVITSDVFHFDGDAVDVDAHLQPAQVPGVSGRDTGLLSAMSTGSYEPPDSIEEGERNSAVLAHVGHLRGRGVPEDLIPGIALDFNRSHCHSPLDDDEVISIASRYEEQAIIPAADLTPDEWPDPKRITAALSKVPEFDVDLLPDVFKPYVADVAELMQAPPDFLAVCLMVAAAATLGNGWAIAPKAKDLSWKVPPVLWGAIIGRPGTKKSPCMTKALAPLLQIEMNLAKAHVVTLQKFHSDMLVYDVALKAAKAQAKKTGTAPLFPLKPEEPQPERLLANDVTYQKLGDILNWSPRGVAVITDELVGLLEAVDAKGQEGARAFYLAAWNGDQSHRIDRIGRGSIVIDRLSVCVLGGIQPGKLQHYVGQAKRGGNSDDGLMQRFQLLVWPDVSEEWVNIDRGHDQLAFNRVMAAFTRLRDLTLVDVDAKTDLSGGPAYLQFDEQAQARFNGAWQGYECLVRSGRCDTALEAHFSKYPRMIAALALVIHLVDGGVGPVGVVATNKAIDWSKYLFRHAHRAYGAADNAAALSARALADKIEQGVVKSGFTARSVGRKGWQHLSSMSDVLAALEWLIDADWIISEEKISKGRPTTVYFINPKTQG